MLAARIYVADSGENKVTVIDPGKPAAAISVSAFPQGIVSDGRRLYVSSAANVLDVIDPITSRLIRSVPLSPKPGPVTISPDGRYVYVCIGSRPIIEAVDTASLMRAKTIETSGVPHSINVTPDNTRMLIGYPGGIDVINVRTGEKEFGIPVTGTPVSIAIESDRHLAIRRLFLHMAGADSFEILDYASRKVTGKVALPSGNTLAVSPDRRTLWATAGDSVVVFGLPDLKRLNTIPVGAGAGAIVFEADGKHAWISNSGANSVVEIDSATYKEVAHFPTGKAPGQMIAVE
jgi:YVTN family beta-propeller protein